jgi:carbonic anhydrase/acetyltransferase-like protein (isoleucine patch superfamily)
MAIYALGELTPDIDPTAYVHPDAVVIGNVKLGAGASVWPQAVLRGDYGRIEIGAGSNIQDGSVIHCTAREATILGDGVVVGHAAHIEGATVGDGALIASGSIVLNGAVVGEGAVVAAGSLVSPGTVIPAFAMAMGTPARVREGRVIPEGNMAANAAMYAANARRYREELRKLD